MSTAQERQSWLDGCTTQLREHFAACGQPEVPANVRVSWGFPSKRATGKRKAIGVCYDPSATADTHSEIFIHPIHAVSEAPEIAIAATLAHELAHAAVGIAAGHKAPFRRVVYAIGLEGKATATVAGEAFRTALTPRLTALGAFPTSGLDPNAGHKKQSTRMLKVHCSECQYVARVSGKWIAEVGPPLCPCNNEPMTAE